MKCESPKIWTGCYSGSFDLISPESYSHPAKLSPALGYRIFEHLRELGLLHDDSVILDCMAGIGTVPLIACTLGLRAISVELEPKFIALEQENKTRLEAKLHRSLDWTILQGDSRQLSKILGEHGLVTVTSPPYAESASIHAGGNMQWGFHSGTLGAEKNWTVNLSEEERRKRKAEATYGQSPGQIGNMKDKLLTADKGGIDWQKAGRPDRLPENLSENVHNVMGTQEFRYSANPENIGNLPDKPLTVMSPRDCIDLSSCAIIDGIDVLGRMQCLNLNHLSVPIVVNHLGVDAVERVISPDPIKLSTLRSATEKWLRNYEDGQNCMHRESETGNGKAEMFDGGETVGNLFTIKLKNGITILAVSAEQQSQLKLWFIMSSPGKMAGLLHSITSLRSASRVITKLTECSLIGTSFTVRHVAGNTKAVIALMEPAPLNAEQNYALKHVTDGSLNTVSLDPNSYLGSMAQVYSEIALVSDVLAVVTKNPTRNKQLRRLDLDTISLLEQTGWRILCAHEAQLFTEHETQDLFGDTKKKVKGRMSFFKRLSWEKGSPVASHEDVIIAVKDGGSNVVTISSPPYIQAEGRGNNPVGGASEMPEGYWNKAGGIGHTKTKEYGQTPGQIGNLK